MESHAVDPAPEMVNMSRADITPAPEGHHAAPAVCADALAAVRLVLAALSGAFKKLNMYSESHSIYRSALDVLKAAVDDFCYRFGALKLDVEREKIGYHGQTVLEGKPGRGDLWYVLHRDGILWICFPTGPELWELDTFLNIARKFIHLEDDEEDDVVTALWEFDMPSIQYDAADLELNECDLIDFSDLPCCDPRDLSESPDHEPNENEGAEHHLLADSGTLSLNEDCLWQLSQDERRQLRQMVAETEVIDGTGYVVDVLLAILERQVQPADEFDNLLESLRQELAQMLVQGRFTSLYGVLSRLREHVQACSAQNHWTARVLENFFESLAGKAFLGGLSRQADRLERCAAAEVKDLKKILELLGGSAVPALCNLLAQSESPALRRLLMDGIVSTARRDYRPLEKLMASCGAATTVQLVPVLACLSDPLSRQTLSGLLRNESEEIRRTALKSIIARDAGSLKDIFKLIDDPDERIRTLILEHLGQQRNPAAEALLLDYLNERQFRFKRPEMLYAICRTLGKCGSDRSIAFLEQHLNTMPLLSSRRVRRKAALIALKELRTERAAALIEKSTSGILERFFGKSN